MNSISDIIQKLITTIAIIILFYLILYAIYSSIYKNNSSQSSANSTNQDLVNYNALPSVDNIQNDNQTLDMHPYSEIDQSPIDFDDIQNNNISDIQNDNSIDIQNDDSSVDIDINDNHTAIEAVQEIIKETPKAKTQQIYEKYEEIMLPSNLEYSSGGYIGRDFVCFRDKLSNNEFVSKNPQCMACQVDTTGKKTYGNTQTNIVATCAYSDDKNNTDPTIWTKQMCTNACGKLKDIN